MDWIKKNPEKFALAVLALALLISSALLVLKAQSYLETFAGIQGDVVKSDKVAPLQTTPVMAAQKELGAKAAWISHHGSLFVSDLYVAQNEQLIQPDLEGSVQIHPPVPNPWFRQHDLDVLSSTVLADDPDGDGFSNLDEWVGKTDPRDKASHPGYYTKLRLSRFIQKPFRLIVKAYDGDPADPSSLNFQINTVDVRQPTQFLKMNDMIPGTKFKIVKFEKKTQLNEKTQAQDDISELTVQNTETEESVVLILNKVIDSPDSYALFKYLWNGKEFAVKKRQSFSIDPEPAVKYKVVDITAAGATIETQSGEKLQVPLLEK